RFFPNLIRKLLQKLLITGKKDAPFCFRRYFYWQGERWLVIDELQAKSWKSVQSVGIGGDWSLDYDKIAQSSFWAES
ncbi:MAG: hypothetical protein F6K50_10080, partial [Moorea sp. SIO3I7]|nr:hypothetical protein [Moorena sp. SIO3I7]